MVIKKRIFWIFVALVMFFAMLFVFQRLLVPKYMSGVFEGRLIGEYYSADKSHDVIFLGDCEVFDNISPVALWDNFGITSYVRGSAQQLVWHSYYLLEDLLQYETPKVVFYSVSPLKYGEPQSEAYNRLTLDGMRMSVPKLRAVNSSMTEVEHAITYVFPILRFHDRWTELSRDDFSYFFGGYGGERVSFNGYMLRADVKPKGFIPPGLPLPGYEFSEKCYEYLDKMTALCKENDIELILIKMPSLYPHWFDQWDTQMVEFAAENGLTYINAIDLIDDIGLDFETDTYNGGIGLNVFGAEKLSIFLGKYLSDNYDITDHRFDPALNAIWNKKTHAYHDMKQTQLVELEEHGEIKTFTFTP